MATMAERFEDGDKGIVPVAKMVYITKEWEFLETGEDMFGTYGHDELVDVMNTFYLFVDGSTFIRSVDLA